VARPFFTHIVLPAGLPDYQALFSDGRFARLILSQELRGNPNATVYWLTNREYLARHVDHDYRRQALDWISWTTPDVEYDLRFIPRQASLDRDLMMLDQIINDRYAAIVAYCPWEHQDWTRLLVNAHFPNSVVIPVETGWPRSWGRRLTTLATIPWRYLRWWILRRSQPIIRTAPAQ